MKKILEKSWKSQGNLQEEKSGNPGGTAPPGTGVTPPPPTWDWGTAPHLGLGYPLERTWNHWKYYGMVMGTPILGVNRQTPVKTVPSRRTTYANSNKDDPTYV